MALGTRSSEDIKRDILDQLYWDSRVNAGGINVDVEDGAVKLTGSVPTYLARQAAQDDARMVVGVHHVDNCLDIAHPTDERILDDAQIGASLARRITAESDLESSDIGADIADGRVTLRGSVDAYWKKRRVEELASVLTGVRGVTNELAVVPSALYEDRLIADSIMTALERNTQIDVSSIDVRVNGGEVTLSGSVPGLPAFRAAQEAAVFTPGVITISNELEIR